MVKADELVKKQKERDLLRLKTYKKVYKQAEAKIKMASSINLYEVVYEVPKFLLGSPLYNETECKEYIIKKLKSNGFKTKTKLRLIHISWQED